ncbi:hypothetical protein ACIQGZ_25795 [Streptomyces sp. NPDC092296]|uniref:hypothetical protein n=1 Tax=Streptomyces sp. NPDC092296 TaxID=3366012 RepID=UPI0038170EBB
MTSTAEAEQLRRALDDFAGTTPAAPLRMERILWAVRRRRARRRAAGIAAGCGLLLTPLALLAGAGGPASTTVSPAAPRGAAGPRIVGPGEKITVGRGITMRLTEDGRQCVRQPGEIEPFCNRVAGPGSGGANKFTLSWDQNRRAILTGSFGGTITPAQVVVRTRSGSYEGRLVTLAGRPDWGAWYADAGVSDASPADLEKSPAFLRSVTLYDANGEIIAGYVGTGPEPNAIGGMSLQLTGALTGTPESP